MKPNAHGWIWGVATATLLLAVKPLSASDLPRTSGERGDIPMESRASQPGPAPVPIRDGEPESRINGSRGYMMALNLLDGPPDEAAPPRNRPPGSTAGNGNPTTKSPPPQNRSKGTVAEPPAQGRTNDPGPGLQESRPAGTKPAGEAARSREILDDPYFIGETPSASPPPGLDPRRPAPGAASGLEEEMDLERTVPRGTLTLPSGPLTQPESADGWNPTGEWYGQDSTPWR
ncbi:MAG: hypothetical protein HQL98_06300 [Magnetococcales bacterium]|nr:hypothetical protein [Magnetococcales bacterium]